MGTVQLDVKSHGNNCDKVSNRYESFLFILVAKMSIEVNNLLLNYLVSGGLAKGGLWGGDECYNAIPMEAHVRETTFARASSLIVFYFLGFYGHIKSLVSKIDAILKDEQLNWQYQFAIDRIFSFFYMGIVVMQIFYKINLHSLVNLLQPCHLTLFLQTAALLSSGRTGILIAILWLPMTAGSGSALLFPSTGGLDQPFEMQLFWIQHILIQVMPLYLLLRHNGAGMKLLSLKSVLLGNWLLISLHWWLFEV